MHHPAIAQHDHSLGNTVDLVHAMTHVDDRDSLFAQQRDHREQGLHLASFERRRGFVHDHHPSIDAHRAREGHHLLDAESKAPQRPAYIHVDAVDVEESSGIGVHAREVDETEPIARLPAEKDVLRHRHQGNEVDLLVDGGDSAALRVERPSEFRGYSAEQQFAIVRLVHASQHFNEC